MKANQILGSQIACMVELDDCLMLRWKKGISGLGGREVGGLLSNGYRYAKHGGKHYLVHRLVYAIYHSKEPEGMIDHIDGNKKNNHPSNLRVCVDGQKDNQQNRRKAQSNSRSQILGVHLNQKTGKWLATLKAGSIRWSRQCDSWEEALAARLEKKAEMHSFVFVSDTSKTPQNAL